MPFSFFIPETKVHKQRNIMRDTDLRLVRYSKRGAALSLFVFCTSMLLGNYYEQQPFLARLFVLGIVCTTLLRSYYLFRFNTLYPRGPSGWRNQFFVVTILSATWWGLMLAAITAEIGMTYEVPLLWFYTIAFFSSCSHVFSVYQRFYSLYMMASLLPCSVVAMLSFNALESVYGLIMLVLFFLLHRQGLGQGIAYWDRLQATYDLTQRANALEAEKITSQSTLSEKDTLFINMAAEIKTALREIVGSLHLLKLAELPAQEEQLVVLAEQKSQQQIQMLQNVLEFSNISKKNIRLNNTVFDLRSVLEKAVLAVSDQVYKYKIEIFTRFTTDFPMRVSGDAERIEQTLINIMSSSLDYAESGSLLIDAHYTHTNDDVGTLKVTVTLDHPIRTAEIEQHLHNAFRPHYASNMTQGLNLAIARGLSNCMGGSAGANYTTTNQLQFWFTVALPTVAAGDLPAQNIVKLNGKRLLLFQPPKIIEDEYKHTLEAWGFVVDIFYEYDSAEAAVRHALKSPLFFDLVMIYTRVDDLEGVALSKVIAEETEGYKTPQLICVTESQSKLPVIEQLLEAYPQVQLLLKPIAYKQLRQRFKDLLIEAVVPTQTEIIEEDFLAQKKVLLLQHEEIDRTIAEVMLKKVGCIVISADTAEDALVKVKSNAYDVFISETHLENQDMKEFISQIKAGSSYSHKNGYTLPVLGLNQHELEGEETRCLQCGMDYYIDAPLQIDDLRAILRRWIGRALHLADQYHNKEKS